MRARTYEKEELPLSIMIRRLSTLILAGLLLAFSAGTASAASRAAAEVRSITIAPASSVQGQVPAITAVIVRTKDPAPVEPAVYNIITVITLPDNSTKSSARRGERFERGQSREFVVPRLFDTKLAGTYKVEFHVYSADMRRRLATAAQTFTVAQGAPAVVAPPAKQAAVKKEEPKQPEAGRPVFGLGIYGNALNPAGGGTAILWPFEHVGIQGIYTVGMFTTTEARLLVKIGEVAGTHPYFGVGYLNVSKEDTVIGVSTTFKDSGISGVIGTEIPLGRRWFGYVEVSGTSIDLKQTVTSGAQTVNASVSYAPVTISAGIVYYLF